MKSFFESPEARELLCHHAGQWVGTPFAPHQRVLGAGVDCVNLVAAIYMRCGFLEKFNPPAYAMDGGKHNDQSQLLQWFEGNPKFLRVAARGIDWPPDDNLTVPPTVGDVLCFKFRSQTAHHVGLKLIGPFFVHALANRRVEVSTLQDRTYASTLAAIYRPLMTA